MPESDAMRMALAATKEAAGATVIAIGASSDAKIALSQIAGHEAKCSERYAGLSRNYETLNSRQWGFSIMLIANLLAACGGLIGILVLFVHR